VPDDGGGEGVVIGVRLEDNQPGERRCEGNPQRGEQGADGGGFSQFAAAQPESRVGEDAHHTCPTAWGRLQPRSHCNHLIVLMTSPRKPTGGAGFFI